MAGARMKSLAGASVVITGASTGIGRASALRLDRAGARIFAGVRSEADENALRAAASPDLTPVRIDITRPETIETAARKVTEALGAAGLAGLVNNAGIDVGWPLEYVPAEDLAASSR